MFFWLLAYAYARDALLEVAPWCTAAVYLLVGFSVIRAIIRDAAPPPPQEDTPDIPPGAAYLIAQICHPIAFADLHECGGGWTRADYDAWLAAQTDAWLVIHNVMVSTSEEINECIQPTPHDPTSD